MAKSLNVIPVVGPGQYGLNTRLERLEIGPQWATDTTNCVIAESGVLAARNGWEPLNDTAISGTPDVKALHEYIDSNGTSRIISAADNVLYEGTTTLTDVTGTATTPTDDHWQFVNFNGDLIGVQAGHAPIVKTDGGDFADISFVGSTTPGQAVAALSAFGRIWYVNQDRQTINYTDLLINNDTDSAGAGSIDLNTVWAIGNDQIVAVAEFNNFLVIFGRRQIIIYQGVDDPNNTLALADIIVDVGALGRDAVQNVGDDIIFLSDQGVMTLTRALQDGSLPLNNLSENVRGYLELFSSGEVEKQIKSAYKRDDGVYYVTFPTSNITFAFSLKYRTPEGLPRVTTWADINPKAMLVTSNNDLYLGQAGYIGDYSGFTDNGSSYEFDFSTGWTSGPGQAAPLNKILKKAMVTVRGGFSQTLTFDWALDFSIPKDSSQGDISDSGAPAEYGTAEYGIAEYSASSAIGTLTFRMSGTGKTVQYGFRSTINGAELLVQRIDVFFKTGRLI